VTVTAGSGPAEGGPAEIAVPGGPWPAVELVPRLLARCSFPPAGEALTCAVSGGADSTALAVLAVAAGCRVFVVHVDHGLRPGSEAEADRVEVLAARLGSGFRAVTVSVGAGPNLEARARTARYAVLPPDVATGHTADDQAETILINLLRGAGLEGLAGMRPGPRRPLLALRRWETRALCDAAGLDVLDDPSNADRRFLRNRVRHELLPLLAELSERDPVPILTRQAEHLRDAADLVSDLALRLDPDDARQLAAAPRALASAAIRRRLRPTGPDHHPPDSATVARVLAVARGERRGTQVSGGGRVSRSSGRLRWRPPEP
jgi:tRNA(Ile)-lysidine synthase